MNHREVIEGVPFIHGEKAIWDEKKPLLDCFSQWLCPKCKANLSADSLICLNACHLSDKSKARFHTVMKSMGKNER